MSPPRYFTCCSLYAGTIFSGVLSVLFCIMSVAYMTYELHKVDEFFSKHQKNQWSINSKIQQTLYDKNGVEIDIKKMVHLLSTAHVEKALCSATLCGDIVLVVISGALIKAAALRKPKIFFLWGLTLLIAYGLGLSYLLLDCSVYGFSSTNNIGLLIYLALGIIFIHCCRCVVRYYMHLKRGNSGISSTGSSSGMAVFDPAGPSLDIFTIQGSTSGTSISTPRIMLKPPSYEEVISAGAPKPNVPLEKPPDYEP